VFFCVFFFLDIFTTLSTAVYDEAIESFESASRLDAALVPQVTHRKIQCQTKLQEQVNRLRDEREKKRKKETTASGAAAEESTTTTERSAAAATQAPQFGRMNDEEFERFKTTQQQKENEKVNDEAKVESSEQQSKATPVDVDSQLNSLKQTTSNIA
jgi:hypothetical protein